MFTEKKRRKKQNKQHQPTNKQTNNKTKSKRKHYLFYQNKTETLLSLANLSLLNLKDLTSLECYLLLFTYESFSHPR